MMTVYIVHWLAKEVNGPFVSSMIEYVTQDKNKAEQFFKEHMSNQQVMNIDGHMCDIRRVIVPANLDQDYNP